MAKKLPGILSLSAAIATLSGVTALSPTPATATTSSADQTGVIQQGQAKGEPNVFMAVGSDLLGLIVSRSAEGTVVAQHYSHSSHASHSSHSSHYSSR
jgi:hypothetical protein